MDRNFQNFPNDFNRKWYFDVGSQIMTAMLFNVVSPVNFVN